MIAAPGLDSTDWWGTLPGAIRDRLSRASGGMRAVNVVACAGDWQQTVRLVSTEPEIADCIAYCEPYIASGPDGLNPTRWIIASTAENLGGWASQLALRSTPIAGTDGLSLGVGQAEGWEVFVRFRGREFFDLTLLQGAVAIVMTSPDDGVPCYLALARALRNRLTETWLRAGGTLIHAAGVDFQGSAALLTGDKRAGKTTQVCELLSAGLRFVSNDRVIVMPDGTVLGLPISVNIRRATRERYPSLMSWNEGSENPHRIGLHASITDISLRPREFASLFSTDIAAASRARALCELSRDGTQQSAQVCRMTFESAAARLEACVMAAVDASQPFYRLPEGYGTARLTRALSGAAARIYLVKAGEGAILETSSEILRVFGGKFRSGPIGARANHRPSNETL